MWPMDARIEENWAAPSWHALSAAEVVDRLTTAPGGLDEGEARRRLADDGANRLPPPPERSVLRRLLAQFDNLLIQLLLGAAVITFAIGHVLDAAVILSVCLLNAAIGFVQEGRAEQALRAIRQMLSARATVLRAGRRTSVPAEDLVRGDVVLLESGDRVPADLRLVRVKGLQAQEAALTGESLPVHKAVEPVAADAPLGDRAGMAYSGTLVTYGQGTGVVVATGAATELGRISSMLAEVEPLTTPLLRQMAEFARKLTLVILALSVAVFAFGVLARDYSPAEIFLAVVSLAVAAIPEGLPAILTIAMAIGVRRMAAENAIIRRLPAVETLGSVSVICSDKTGTLTRNEMTVRSVVTAARTFTVGGVGYSPHGGLSLDGREALPEEHPPLEEIARAAALCNDARLREADGVWLVEGDPLEGALLAFSRKAGLDPELEAELFPRTDVIPFESEHRFMASLHHEHGAGEAFVYVKGAPERILEMCVAERRPEGDAPLRPGYWRERLEALAADGQRVLAIALRPVGVEYGALRFADVEGGLSLLGLFGLIDPPRPEAIEAVRACREAGVRVKMITGDHAATACAIARRLGFENPDVALTGAEIEGLPDQALRERASSTDVFARASPQHKLRLVQGLQAQGFVVAMTGDGVNDAPALKQADVGVAMGVKGTEAAKEAAEMVLADDNFASIVNAVREGRTVYDNLKKAIAFLLPINGGESLSIVVAIMLGATLPISPLQILWVNMVSSVGLALALAFEPTEPDAMRRPPRAASEALLSPFLLWRISLVSALFLAGIYGVFSASQRLGASLEEARTLAVNTLVAMEVFYLFSVRFLRTRSLTWKGALGTRPVLAALGVVIGLQLVFTYAPVMALLFGSSPLSLAQNAAAVTIGALLFVVLELEKAVRRRAAGP